MRLLSAEEFKKEPYGTVYCMYQPQVFLDQLKIKTEPRGENSWYATDLTPWPIGEDYNAAFKELKSAEDDSKYEIKTEMFSTDDSTYNHYDDMKFATFNKKEVIGIINLLVESLAY